ncbi:MAG TPA: quinolinate synthase NadA [Candidatus Deferrimicrobium sp.]|nr:quinolinate synthase NadA [Candidatus Deferrimicrobium sp.]
MVISFSNRIQNLQAEILRLKEKDNIFIMAHYYQPPEVQAIADAWGDSLGLSRIAQKEAKSEVIIFAGVVFMAETAAILNPQKTVFIPDIKATCPMASQCPAAEVLSMKKQFNLPVVLYVNTLAEAKAHADILCTSANAVKICQSLGSQSIIFGPDWNLGWHVNWKTGLEIIPIPEQGYCYVHKKFRPEDFRVLKKKYPKALITVHPECNPEVQQLADHVGSTTGIIKFIKNSDVDDFIIGTEVGLEFMLQRETDGQKRFHFARTDGVCQTMKLNTLEKIKRILLERPKENIITVPQNIADNARKSIQKMLEAS